jgi:penicillin-binding protein 1C
VVLDPSTGAVLAMVGSVDYAGPDGQLNITTTLRHPGSTLKPFVYALAIEEGGSPASLAADLQDHVPGYRPRRQMRQRGIARYREALGGSYNLAAVDVLDHVGVAPLLERLRQAGLGPLPATAPEYGLDLALGAARVRLLDLAAAYGFVVNGGTVVRPRGLVEQDSAPVRVFSPQVSYLVMDMLADPNARRASFGADLPFDLPFRVVAKTGTSSGFADTLAIAATREAIVAAWSGAFDGSGTRGALAMWSAAPIARAGLLAVRDWHGASLTLPAAPDGLAEGEVCAVTGLRPGPRCPTKHEHFIDGTVPRERCAGH